MKKIVGINNILDAGPSEFLWLIANATCMVTNSFHGTAFSVNFATPFCCVLNRKRKNNGRMISFLDKVDMSNRILYEDSIAELNVMTACSEVTNNHLRLLVDNSIDYLKSIIENKEQKC